MRDRAGAVRSGKENVENLSAKNAPASAPNCVILFGPTACGKTAIGVAIARERNGEIISADSRQVYKGLDIGSGKDLDEYSSGGKAVPYHLIDITDLKSEYNVFQYQNDFYRAFTDVADRKKLPVVVGGTGMYLDAVIRNYDLVEVPENGRRRAELEAKPLEELASLLLFLKPDLHTREDLRDKARCIRAIEIAEYMQSPEAALMRKTMPGRPDIRPLVIGTTLLRKDGASWQRLERLGLEYKFVAEYLQGKIASRDELYEKLNVAIRRFAKRQETWFRGMERKMKTQGAAVHWLPCVSDVAARTRAALSLIDTYIEADGARY